MSEKKPRAKTINKNWAAIDSIGWQWHFLHPRKHGCAYCLPKHCASEYAHPEFVEAMNAAMLAEHLDPALKYARKGRRCDLAMARAVQRPEVQAAIQAAALAASTPDAQPAATTQRGRL